MQQKRQKQTQSTSTDSTLQKPVGTEIKAEEVVLIGADGTKLGKMTLKEAIAKGNEQNLTVLQLNEPKTPTAPVITKLVNYNQWKAEQRDKLKERKAKQSGGLKEMKMIRIVTRIDPHDLTIKCNKIRELLIDLHPVRLTIIGRDRDVAEALLNSMMTSKEMQLMRYGNLQDKMTLQKNYVVINPLSQEQRKKLQREEERSEQPSNTSRPTNPTPTAAASPDHPRPNPQPLNTNKQRPHTDAQDAQEVQRATERRIQRSDKATT